jgi:myo-inositol-1(or 4)-monophosphatase
MCFVACGRVEGYWEENLKPWDTAAGWLIVEEAGGRVSDYSGGKFAIEKKQLLATNGAIHDDMREVLASCLK